MRLPGHAAGGVLQIAEGQGLGRTGLGAGRCDLAVTHRTAFVFCPVFALLNTLDTEGAFFHDTGFTDGDIRVELTIERRRPVGLAPVETPHLIRAVVGAIARTDATIIYLGIQALRVVIGGIHRTDRLAGCIAAVLAQHGRKADFGRVRSWLRLLEIALNPQPGHFPALRHHVLAHHRDIIFGIAGRDAGSATETGRQVDTHAPAVLGIPHLRVHIAGGMLGMVRVMMFVVLSCRYCLGDAAAKLLTAAVRCHQRRSFAGARETDRGRKPREAARGGFGLGRKQMGRVGTASLGVASICAMAQADRHGYCIAPQTGVEIGARLDGSMRRANRQPVALRNPQAFGGLGVNLKPGIPDRLRDRVGQFLQPGLVGAAAVIIARRGVGNKRQRVFVHSSWAVKSRLGKGCLKYGWGELDRERLFGLPYSALLQGVTPEGVKVARLTTLAVPFFPRRLQILEKVLPRQRFRERLVNLCGDRQQGIAQRLGLKHGRHDGLHQTMHAGFGMRVSPAFQGRMIG